VWPRPRWRPSVTWLESAHVLGVGVGPGGTDSGGWIDALVLMGILIFTFVAVVWVGERLDLRAELNRWLHELLDDDHQPPSDSTAR
jgi:hypothetical protein